jgi:hypothetical protein
MFSTKIALVTIKYKQWKKETAKNPSFYATTAKKKTLHLCGSFATFAVKKIKYEN